MSEHAPDLTLYYSPGACSMASHITLEEAGATFSTERILVHAGETGSPDYLEIDPRGRVPALRIGTTVLTESCAIMTYVADRFPQAGLLPDEALARAQCLSVTAWIASTVHPCFAHIVKPSRFAADEAAHAALVETGTKSYWGFLQEIDEMIGEGPWLFGSRFTLCDAYALPFWGFGRRIRLPMQELKHYTAWKDRIIERPAVLRVLQREESLLLNPGKMNSIQITEKQARAKI